VQEPAAAPPIRTDSPGGAGDVVDRAARALASGMLPGLVVGVVVGGLGSRRAMRIMAMASPAARGFTTDFGATVGEITAGGTLFLLILGGLLGMIGGIVYVAIRGVLPWRGWLGGLAFGVVLLALFGRLLVVPDNPDFVILSPAGLAVAMFSALPVVFGLGFVPLAERLRPRILRTRHLAAVTTAVALGLVPFVALGGLGLMFAAAALIVCWLAPSVDSSQRKTLRRAGALLLAGLVVWRGVVFVLGVVEIL
jgi:hypothetical protein